MATDIIIPEIGENIDSGEVVKVLVSKGDMVEAEQGIVELETDKAVVELPSPEKGRIIEITVSEGDTVKTGQTIGKIEAGDNADDETENDRENDSHRKADDEENESAEKSRESSESQESEDKKIRTDESGEGKEKQTISKKTDSDKQVPASPSVRRFSRELGVDIHRVRGTGSGGRISQDDIKNYVKKTLRKTGQSEFASNPAASQPELPNFEKWGRIKREPMNKVRSIIASGTGATWKTIPHVTQFDEADITDLEKFRKKYSKKAEEVDGKLTITTILAKTIAEALKIFPYFNASIDMQNQEIIFKKYINIGIAVATERGLLVPVVKDADQKSILKLSSEINEMANKTRDKKILPDDLEGGTFTISNQGGIGGTNFTPIVYWPQVAILGVSRTSMKSTFIDNEFKPRSILPLSLSYDHRIIDGADAARFLSWVCEALEQPFLMHL